MTPKEIIAILFDLMSGKPWSPKPGITITASQNMQFEIRSDGDKLIVTWSDPYVHVKGSFFGFSVNGNLTGLIVERTKIKALISGPIPDVTYDLNEL